MFKSLKTTLTFVTLLLFVLALSAQVEAKGHAKVARHANRIIRKRAPQTGQTGGGGGGTNGGAAVESSGSIAQSESTSTSTTVSVAPSTSSTSSTASTTTTRGGLLSTLLSDLLASSTSSVASTTSTTSTSTTTTSSTPPATSAPAPTVNVGSPSEEETVTPTTKIVSVGVEASQTADASEKETTGAATTGSGVALTVIIAVAASIGFVIVIWTIFRKWKLARSARFDKRLNPIDWEPTNDDVAGAGVPGSHRRATSDTSSFHSGVNHGNGSDTSHNMHPSLGPLPDHDFTAPPVGQGAYAGYNTGYADLNRGPSPQPPMNELNRGPSLARSNYDPNVPLHHQNGYNAQDYRY